MTISDLSIRRPVFATVASLLLAIVGLMAALKLSVREYPDVARPIVGVDVYYRGASAKVVETRITQVLEDEIAGIEGIEKLTSSSRDEYSRVNVEFTLERDLDDAANDVRERVSRVVAKLPPDADPPQISKVGDNADAVIYINVSSPSRNSLELTDYAERQLVDRLSAVPGVALVRISGARRYAMRIWIDRESLASRELTVADVEAALRRENVELPAGRIESHEREFQLRTETSYTSEEEFRELVVGRGPDGYLVRLGDVGRVELGAEDLRSVGRSDGVPGVSLAIIPQSKANVLDVANGVKAEIARIQPTVPRDMIVSVNIDFSMFIVESMKKVIMAIGETLAIVLVVIFLFLGSLRATLIPAVTIPVSLLSAALVMAAFGYSLNTLTLLGFVLAIGLVVDDAIVVLENIVRRVELGEPGLIAAMNGSREIGFAVIATTMVLIAVFVPISYLGGTIGRLFGEFGITVAAAVAFSAFVALTLTPMMTSKLFADGLHRGRIATAVDAFFNRFSSYYESRLQAALAGRRPAWVLGLAFGSTLVAIAVFVLGLPPTPLKLKQEFAPTEDRAMIPTIVTAPEGSSIQYLDRHLHMIEDLYADEVARGNAVRIIARSGSWARVGDVNVGTIFMPLQVWSKRDESSMEIIQRLRRRVADVPGVRAVPILPASLGVTGQTPVQVVLGGTSYEQLAQWRDRIIARATAENPQLLNLDSDYQERKPQVAIRIDRNKAADLGVSLETVGRTLETMLGARIVTTFVREGEEFNVLVQARDTERASIGDLDNIYVRAGQSDTLIPLASLVRVEETAGPGELKRFDRLRSITLTANLAPGYSLGEALTYLENAIRAEIPEGVRIGYDGQSRELKQAASGLTLTFGFALLIVYLVLAAQFESFVHPIVILGTVPLALTGAVVGLWLFGSSINVFSQIGAIMLIGIACKNGILIVEFANQLRDQGRELVAAVIEAATIRLRPVMMTSLCTAFGAVPLMIATGAGAESRQSIGATVFFGTIVSLAFTLFVVPALYALVARNTRSPQYVSRLIERLKPAAPGAEPGAEPKGANS